MNGDDSPDIPSVMEKADPTAMVVVEEDMPVALTPTGLATDGKTDGIIDLQIPNLLPTDNVSEERTVKIRRTKIPVRITRISLEVIDNGYIVELPQAGRQSDFGPDGSRHSFTTKLEMLEFIGKVVGQVTYQYNETEMRHAMRTLRRMEEALEAGDDVVLEGYETAAATVQG